ncbi:VCBS repeat-containing protein [Segetibacter koreensis]|uniref:VCBS repeat-containing protein n=1 Tax=Segetibacter koreensis TaxID=398037 RepID=UPI0003646F7B|nr:VCBS repeat-containing protein [Segetibacter koreensis]
MLPSSQTGIHFNNKVEENDKYNVFEYMNIYTGAGVAAGDINNDGLVDLYFSGNETPGKLYLNKGNFKFEDITEKAGLLTNRWCTGVSMVDINGDGFLDIYVNVAGSSKFGDTHNLFYINNGFSHSPGNSPNRQVTFTEKATEYGVAETRQTMNASFFDYDRDGDLDLFLITNPADEMVAGVNDVHGRKVNGESLGTDILYRNNGASPSGDLTFSDVSREAGILVEGYSLGAAISDVNGDGWPDIYVSNDFLTNDILYINNGNGSFSDKTAECLKHTSFASMGNDIADFNNDGLPDIYTLDMLPEDNYRKKMIIPAGGYDKFQLLLQRGYEPQYTRNALQLNNGNGTFSDISFLSGVSSTDWSWSALWADYDNDGDKDLMVTNGFYRDLGNLDYINYQPRKQNPMGTRASRVEEKLKAIKNLEEVPLQSYLFENNNDLTLTKRSDDWGFTQKGFSNGACYADLDNDGDLDLVINCFNSEAKIYRNNGETNKNTYLNILLKGKKPNTQGIGAKLYVYTNGKMQFQEFYPYRGYESSVEPVVHFGLGRYKKADSLKIIWPDGSEQTEYNVKGGQILQIDFDVKDQISNKPQNVAKHQEIFSDITGKTGLVYQHKEADFEDFKIQPLLPHMFSKNGPGIAVGDVNGDGREDFFIGGTAAGNGSFFFQSKDGSFIQHPLEKKSLSDDMGVLLFDADNDNDLDLYIVGGGSESQENSEEYQDAFFKNDGKGNFRLISGALPDTKASGSCVVASDYDHDGDLDLFVGGRVSPGNYPLPPRSYLLRNDSHPADENIAGEASEVTVKFTDVTSQVCPYLSNIGMVTSALWSDYDNDGWQDLVLAGEFKPLTFIKNEKGRLNKMVTVEHSSGWWNSITAADFDNDGDIDYVAGNLGLNSRHKATVKEPLCIYAKDYDKDGRIDPIMCYYVNGKNYIYPTRDEIIKQINSMRRRFPSYADYAKATFEESFLPTEISDAYVIKSECFESSYFENKGNGSFIRKPLVVEAQFAPVFGMIASDYNNDGNMDILIAGNSYSTEVSTGRYDAMEGLLLSGDGKGNFKPLKSSVTGFKADRDVKGLAEITANGSEVILVANNDNNMQAFQFKEKPASIISIKNTDAYAIVKKKNGRFYRQEFYYGSNYLSQSSRKLKVGKDVNSIDIFDYKGNSRKEVLPR